MADRLQELREFLPTIDADLKRVFPFEVEEVRATGDANAAYNMRGLAAVYNKWSLDLGGFRERVKPGAFDTVLDGEPHVLHLWDHSTLHTLSSTRNGTLELKSVPKGLQYYSRVARTSYAEDLRVLLERGDIDQSSFAFTVEKDEWRIVEEDGEEDIVERTIVEVRELFDVTTCAMGAYPQTEAALAVRKLARGVPAAQPVVTNLWVPSVSGAASTVSVASTAGAEPVAPSTVGEHTPDVAPDADVPDVAARAATEAIEGLKRSTRDGLQAARNRYIRGKDE